MNRSPEIEPTGESGIQEALSQQEFDFAEAQRQLAELLYHSHPEILRVVAQEALNYTRSWLFIAKPDGQEEGWLETFAKTHKYNPSSTPNQIQQLRALLVARLKSLPTTPETTAHRALWRAARFNLELLHTFTLEPTDVRRERFLFSVKPYDGRDQKTTTVTLSGADNNSLAQISVTVDAANTPTIQLTALKNPGNIAEALQILSALEVFLGSSAPAALKEKKSELSNQQNQRGINENQNATSLLEGIFKNQDIAPAMLFQRLELLIIAALGQSAPTKEAELIERVLPLHKSQVVSDANSMRTRSAISTNDPLFLRSLLRDGNQQTMQKSHYSHGYSSPEQKLWDAVQVFLEEMKEDQPEEYSLVEQHLLSVYTYLGFVKEKVVMSQADGVDPEEFSHQELSLLETVLKDLENTPEFRLFIATMFTQTLVFSNFVIELVQNEYRFDNKEIQLNSLMLLAIFITSLLAKRNWEKNKLKPSSDSQA